MIGRYGNLRWILPLLLVAAVGGAVIIGAMSHSPVHCIARAPGISGVSMRVTRGPTHTFYYPNRLRWEWDRLRKGLGVSSGTNSYAITFTPPPGSDVLWVAITYRDFPRVISPIVAEEVDGRGHIRALSAAYSLLDADLRMTVSRCALMGGVERYRGEKIRLRDMPFEKYLAPGKEFVTIEFR